MTPRAAVWSGVSGGFELVDVTTPELAAGEALVEIELATICGSDIHTVSGHRATPMPTVLGHEAVGRVVGTTPSTLDVDGSPVQIGDRVTWTIGTACGRCRRCLRGIPEKCEQVRKYGHERITESWRLNGEFATHTHLIAGTGIVPVPEELPAALAAPSNCATATVVAAARRAGLRPGDDVAVLGCGMLGLTAILLARESGAARIVATDIDEGRRALAAEFGADVVVDPSGLREAAGPAGVDVVFEVSGNPRSVEAALDCAGIGGVVALVGSVSPSDGVVFEPSTLVRRLVTVVGSHNYTASDLADAVAFLSRSSGTSLLAALVSDPFPLEALDVAFDAARAGVAPRVSVSSVHLHTHEEKVA